MFVVYKHTSPSGKVYIGMTSQDVNKRWSKGIGYKANSHFWKSICKYGWDNFRHEILEDNLTKEEACELEIDLIKKYQSNNPLYGYNLSSGGECIASGVKCSQEKREKIRQGRLGEKHWFYGKHLSEEHKQKISMSCKGKTYTPENKLKFKEIATRLRGVPVRCVETQIVYVSVTDASEKTNIGRSAISQVLTGKHKTAGGYHWEYA
jgi:group I intron endonuclease